MIEDACQTGDTAEQVKLDGLTGGVIEDACQTGDTDERVNLDGLT